MRRTESDLHQPGSALLYGQRGEWHEDGQPIDIADVFGAFAQERRWITWRWEDRNGKADKPPYSPIHGGYASATDPTGWVTLEEAERFREQQQMNGVGIQLGKGLGGIDLDGCRDSGTGAVARWAMKVLRLFRSYTEVSPSGTGLKIFATGAPASLPASTIAIRTDEDYGKTPKIECFVERRYFTVTGQLVDGCPEEIVDCGEVGGAWDRMRDLLAKRNPNRRAVGQLTGNTDLSAELEKCLHGTGVIGRLWQQGKNGGRDRSRNDAALAAALGAAGFSDSDIEAALRCYALGQIGQQALTGKAADRQVARLLGIAAAHAPSSACETPSPNGNGPGITVQDFYAYLPMHEYIFVPSRELWPAGSVNSKLPPVATGRTKRNGDDEYESAAAWLDRERSVEQMTWAPGEPLLIRDRLVSHGGWIERPGCKTFNLYRPPVASEPGDPHRADPWLQHLFHIYPTDAGHIIAWLAHRVQRPGEKINHALVLGGLQGIGKDTLLEPVKVGIGPWNFQEVAPSHLLGRFNDFVKSVILRISEARDLGDVNRYAFYDHLKAYTAAPPDVLRVDEKHTREYSVFNVCGVIITTNYKSDGIYLPADDRRHYVAWCDLRKEAFSEQYWNRIWRWYGEGGTQDVIAYLTQLDLTSFNPKAPPPKTAAFWDIVDANRAPEDADLADVLEGLAHPDATTLAELTERADGAFRDWLLDRKNRRQMPHRLESVGYVPVRNAAAKDGLWKIRGKRQAVYARQELSVRDRIAAAGRLSNEELNR